jgi:hypothetical protein
MVEPRCEPVAVLLPATPHAPNVASGVALGMAFQAGFPALAAHRIAQRVAAAVAHATGRAELVTQAGRGQLAVTLAGEGDWHRAADELADDGATAVDGRLSVVFAGTHRGGLHVV